MTELYTARYQVAWADVDANGHMMNSRYLDYATQTRFLCIAEHGFTPADFHRHRIGPVIFEDHIRYRRELRLLEEFEVSFRFETLDGDERKFRVANPFTRDGDPIAEVVALGAWFDLDSRSVVEPPPELLEALRRT